ncbi:MAG: immunoglobulin domain-containing protein [Verrucomicrobiae bacterium]
MASSREPIGLAKISKVALAVATPRGQFSTRSNVSDTNNTSFGISAAQLGKVNPSAQVLPADQGQISAGVLKQIVALQRAKAGRPPAQDKLDSQLIYAARVQNGEAIAEGISFQRVDLDKDSAGRILVDITAEVTAGLLGQIQSLGGNIVNSFAKFHAIRAGLPVDAIELLAARAEVKFIAPAARAICHTGSVESQGDYAHDAVFARQSFGVDGTGVKVGVLSDSVDYLTNSQALGDLPGNLAVLAGQSGVPGSGEGTAMLEIVHDLAPGSQLYFATAFSGAASFAQNILDLRAAGCDIIVDDVYYYNESPFQDAVIAQAVNSVTASGALYFSSAGNSGNVDSGTAGTWEGDFADGGATASPLENGRIHSFATGTNYDTVAPGGSDLRVDLFWSDPLGAAANDYDFYVLDSTGTSVVASSTTRQNGTQDPYENTPTLASGERIVIVKYSGAGRFLHLETGRGMLAINTPGNTKGHSCATNAFCVAAVRASDAGGSTNAFAGGSQDSVEYFSSDGPRRVFYQADGTPITPGDFSSAGGAVRQKPDIAAADGVSTTLPSGSGLNPFYGTSAAAPHAGAVAALLKSYNPALSAAQMRNVLTNSALDIMAVGADRDSGSGIVMATAALQAAPPDTLLVLSGGLNLTGPAGGSFNPALQNLTLTNIGAGALTWSLSSTSAWLNASPLSGTLPVGAQSYVAISPASAANTLPVGTYTTFLVFSNQTSSVAQSRTVTLQVLPVFGVTPSNGFASSGMVGGPFSVNSQTYALTNLGALPLNWGIVNTSAWLTVSSSAGTLAGGAGTSLAISLNSAANALAVGNYASTVVVTNPGASVNLNFTLQVRLSLVQNGDFETGNFTGWTQSGNTAFTSVASGNASYVHAGTYGAELGPSGSLGYLSQTLPTSSGQAYLLTFWLSNPVSGSTEQFQVNWNGVTVTNITNPVALGWTKFNFIVAAAVTNTVLQFGFRNDPDYFGLDDISVTPVFAPTISTQPTNLTVLSGGSAVFSATVAGTTNLVYRWRKGGTNLANGAGISGATTTNLSLTTVTTNSTGNYTLYVTNAYGSITSSIAALTVVLPAAIASSTVTNRTVECGKNTNTFTVTASGTAPLSIRWSTNGVPIIGATNASFALTNLHPATVTNVGVTVTNLYGTATTNAVITVFDSLAPVITLIGSNPLYHEFGSSFTDPGATANDTCAGTVTVVSSGGVNSNVLGTNTLTYLATDGSNSATNTRTVIVRDTTPPTIVWSFTNVVFAADTNCGAPMPDVTGTNFIIATDASGALTLSQSPTNNFLLPLGTNTVVITIADASGNTAYSTNTMIVLDQTPPVFLSQPQNLTNFIGTSVTFSTAATACTPLTYQWYSNTIPTLATNPTLTLSNLTLTAAGNYFVVASANGGASTSLVATLTVNLIPPGINGTTANLDGSFSLNLTGSPGYPYILEATTNLFSGTDWLPLATNYLGTNGVWNFTDTAATNFPQQFYRLRLAP